MTMPNIQRRDLYGECNMEGAPVDVFTAECCMYCFNPECSRSSFGKSKFDIRVNTWYERLFSSTPRMTPDDPRYEGISAQKFLVINPALMVNSTWVDPKDIPSQESGQISIPIISELLKTEQSEPQPKPPQQKSVRDLALINTSIQQNQMLSRESKPEIVASDPWKAPIPTTDTENVRIIKPGEKIKLG